MFMKSFFRNVVLWLLKGMAKRRIRKYKGKVIAVTGSIGKTSTKEAIFTVLNSQFKVARNKKSMNTEFGLLLTILDVESGFTSAFKWSWLLAKAFINSFTRDHSDILLLEMGVDKPGDMDFLVSVVRPDIGVMTNICPVHMAEGQFKDLSEIFAEKSKMVGAVKENGIAVLNIDNEHLEDFAKKLKKKNIATYGKNRDADYKIGEIGYSIEGISFDLKHERKTFAVKASVIGEYQAYVLVPAIICANLMGIETEVALASLLKYTLPPGRMSLISAINGALILDSSYNSSPESLKEALKILRNISGGKRKIAVLGNMNELGEKSKSLHQEVGELVPECADVLITVGAEAKLMAEKATASGMSDKNIYSFKTASEAADFIKDKIEEKDVVLVKGSQNNVRLERFVKTIMAHPEEAKDLLVRQEKVWLDRM